MKVNIEFPVANDEGKQGVLKYQAELSGNLVKELDLYDTIAARTGYEMIISKIKED